MIRVGTDCSGIEAPIQALKKLGINFSHEFASDIDKHVISSIKANYNPKILFGDILQRDIALVPDIDLYICGFPCQSFSQAGYRKGFDDERGVVFYGCLKVISVKKPSYFILENVKGLINHNNGETFKTIINDLEELGMYDIYHKILNTRDYGIPQNRERVYIIGILKSLNQEWKWPEKKPMQSLNDFVDYQDNNSREIINCAKKTLTRIPPDSKFINLGFVKDKFPNSGKYSPTLLKGNCSWCVPMSRYSNIKELLMLQGFPTDFKQVVSLTQLKSQIGNSMSVNVIECLLECLLKH